MPGAPASREAGASFRRRLGYVAREPRDRISPLAVVPDVEAHLAAHAAPPAGRFHETSDFAFAWRGVLYLPGHRRGHASVAALAERLRRRPLPEAVADLRGAYALLILDKGRRELWALVDASGCFPLYLTPAGPAPDCVAALRRLPDPLRALTPRGFLVWVAYGTPLPPETPFAGIRRITGDELVRLDATGSVRRLPRPTPVPDGDLQTVLAAEMAALATALAGERVSVDLTGGLDSRLVVAFLHHAGVVSEAAVIGPEDGPEVDIARRLARILGMPLHVTVHRLDDLATTLPTLLRATGGEVDPARYHPDAQFQRERRARGCTVAVGGAGGAHLREMHYVHELPFLPFGRKGLLRRLWRLKFYPVTVPEEYLSERLDVDDYLWAHFLERARPHLREDGIATLEVLIARLHGAPVTAGLTAAAAALGLDLAVPLYERTVVEAAIRTGPWRRLLHREMRRALATRAPEIAAVPTILGYGCAADPRSVAIDAVRLLGFQCRRIRHRIHQRFSGRGAFALAADRLACHPGYEEALRRSGLLERALRVLKETGVVAPALVPERIRPPHRAVFVHAGLLLEAVG